MKTVKIVAVAVIAVIMAGGLYWVTSLAKENERLESDLNTATEANAAFEHALQVMKELQAENSEIILRRERQIMSTQAELKQKTRELRDVQESPQITVVERECMQSDIPVPILDILRETPSGERDSPSRESLPTGRINYATGDAVVYRHDLGPSSGIHQGITGFHNEPSERPRGGQANLPITMEKNDGTFADT